MTLEKEPWAEYLLLYYNSPGDSGFAIGVFVWCPELRAFHYRISRSWINHIPLEEQEMAIAIVDELSERITQMGAEPFLLYCEDTLSNVLTLSERRPLASAKSVDAAVDQLFRAHVQLE